MSPVIFLVSEWIPKKTGMRKTNTYGAAKCVIW